MESGELWEKKKVEGFKGRSEWKEMKHMRQDESAHEIIVWIVALLVKTKRSRLVQRWSICFIYWCFLYKKSLGTSLVYFFHSSDISSWCFPGSHSDKRHIWAKYELKAKNISLSIHKNYILQLLWQKKNCKLKVQHGRIGHLSMGGSISPE